MTAQEARELTRKSECEKLKIMTSIYDRIKVAAKNGKRSIKYYDKPVCPHDYYNESPQIQEIIDTLRNNGYNAKLYKKCNSITIDVYILIEW